MSGAIKKAPPTKATSASKDASAWPIWCTTRDRLKKPLIRRNGKFEEATWDEALDLVASKLKTYKSSEIGVVSSARSTNEANYVMQKFGRAVLGTNNVDHCARL